MDALTLRDLPLVTFSEAKTRLIESQPMLVENGSLSWAQPQTGPIDHWAELTQGQHTLWLGFVQDQIISDFDWRSYESDVQELAWCAAHDPLVAAFNVALLSDWTLKAIHDDGAPSQQNFSIGFEFRSDTLRCVGHAYFASELLPKIRTVPGLADNPPVVDIDVPLTIDSATVSARDFKKIGVGAFISMRLDAKGSVHTRHWRLTSHANGDLAFTPNREFENS